MQTQSGVLPTDHADPEGRYQRTMWTQRDRRLVDTYVLIKKSTHERRREGVGAAGKEHDFGGQERRWMGGVRPAARKGRLEFTTRGGGGGIQPLEFKSTGVRGVRPAAQPPSDRCT